MRHLTCLLVLLLGAWSQLLWAQQKTSSLRFHDKPKWFEITGNGFTSGSLCLVRSAATHQTIGQLEPGHKFLAFGANSSWITFAHKGQMAYVAASAATELFPNSTPSTEWKSAGTTLEQRLAESRERGKSGPLAPSFTNNPTPKPTATPAMEGAGRGGRGGGEPGMGAMM